MWKILRRGGKNTWKNYGWRFMTFYKIQGARTFPKGKKCKKAKMDV